MSSGASALRLKRSCFFNLNSAVMDAVMAAAYSSPELRAAARLGLDDDQLALCVGPPLH